MVEIEEILEELNEIKNVNDKIKYLENLSKTIKEKDLLESINDLIMELKFPVEDRKEIRFSMPQVVEEEREEKKLENIVRVERPEEEEIPIKQEYFTSSLNYESGGINPFMEKIKQNLEERGFLRRGEFITQDKKELIREEIMRYSPGLPEEKMNNYLNMVGNETEKYHVDHVPVSMIERVNNELDKEKKYIKRFGI